MKRYSLCIVSSDCAEVYDKLTLVAATGPAKSCASHPKLVVERSPPSADSYATRCHLTRPAPAILPQSKALADPETAGAKAAPHSIDIRSSFPSTNLTTLGFESVFGRARSYSAGMGNRDISPEVWRTERRLDEMATE